MNEQEVREAFERLELSAKAQFELHPEAKGNGQPAAEGGEAGSNDIALVLHTSGTTSLPKGVCISHHNALAFVEWAANEVAVRPQDRLSSHAPFHFDLSVFDLYCAFWGGASVHVVPEEHAARLAPDRSASRSHSRLRACPRSGY